MRDRLMVEIVNPSLELNARGSAVAIGTCPRCSGKVHGMLAAADVPPALKAKQTAFREKKKGGTHNSRPAGRKSGGAARKSRGGRKSGGAARKSRGARSAR